MRRYALGLALLAGCASSAPSVQERACVPGDESLACAFGPAAERSAPSESKSVLGRPLEVCGTAPMTGFYRDGRCETGPEDTGVHVVCAEVTEAFLTFSRARGNDLVTPRGAFVGLHAGDRWCLCAARWQEAFDAGVAPPVVLSATHSAALRTVSEDALARSAR